MVHGILEELLYLRKIQLGQLKSNAPREVNAQFIFDVFA